MSDTATALEQRALECERKAAWVANADEAAQERFLALARAWREMAADYEELTKRQTERRRGALPSSPASGEALRDTEPVLMAPAHQRSFDGIADDFDWESLDEAERS